MYSASRSTAGGFTRRSYWDYDFCFPDPTLTREEAEPEIRRLLAQAVRRQLTADVPVGSYLSGGIDSGSIVSVASGELDRMNTFHLRLASGRGGGRGARLRRARRGRAHVLHLQDRAFRTGHRPQRLGGDPAAIGLPSGRFAPWVCPTAISTPPAWPPSS